MEPAPRARGGVDVRWTPRETLPIFGGATKYWVQLLDPECKHSDLFRKITRLPPLTRPNIGTFRPKYWQYFKSPNVWDPMFEILGPNYWIENASTWACSVKCEDFHP